MMTSLEAEGPQPPPVEPPEYWRRVQLRQDALRATCLSLFPCSQVITLELGCGHGHYLTSYAQAFPAETCLGVDLVTKRIEKAQAKANKRDLKQLHFLKAEARELLTALPEHVQLGKVLMLFPDPWPKKRHHKNRMIQPDFLTRLAEMGTSQTRFYFRTDHAGYFQWTEEILEAHAEWKIVEDEPWLHEERSFFQDLMREWQSLVARVQKPQF